MGLASQRRERRIFWQLVGAFCIGSLSLWLCFEYWGVVVTFGIWAHLLGATGRAYLHKDPDRRTAGLAAIGATVGAGLAATMVFLTYAWLYAEHERPLRAGATGAERGTPGQDPAERQ